MDVVVGEPMIVEDRGEIGLADHAATADGAFAEAPRVGEEAFARQRLENVEHLFGVFLVGDQLAEMAEGLERAQAQRLTAGIGENGIGESNGGESGGSHDRRLAGWGRRRFALPVCR